MYMKTWMVKKEFGKEMIQREQDKEEHYLHRKGTEWWIQDKNGKVIIRVKRNEEHVEVSGGICGSGTMKMEMEHPYFQPARVKALYFLENKEKYTLVQTPKREYTIYQNDQVIGRINGLDGWKAEIQMEDQVTDEMAELSYLLAEIMYHQDDLILV